MPYNRDKDLRDAKEMATKNPTLMLMKQNGKKELGWKGAEFYWPVLVMQKKVDTAVYTLLSFYTTSIFSFHLFFNVSVVA